MGISELEYFLLSSGGEAISIRAFAENARDGWRYSRSAVIETSRGIEVADAVLFGEEGRMRYGELQEPTEFLNAKRGGLLVAIERKHKFKSEAPE